jgi:gas vesicle protein
MNSDNVIGFGIGLLAGAAIGGTMALLYAPNSGKKTRKLIKNKATEFVDDVKEEANEVVDEVKEKTGGVIDKVKEAASRSSQRGKAAVKAVKG